MSKPDYLMRAKIMEACAAAGVLESAFNDFIVDNEAFKFDEASLPAYIEQCRKEKPHRFAIQNDHDAELCQSAFIATNLTAQGKLLREVGPARFAELKALYADGVPESVRKNTKTPDHSKNPWAPIEGNINLKTGRYTEAAIARQMSLVRATGAAKAAQIAASVSSKLGDLYAPGFKSNAA